ncbi:hypothetical protein ACE4RU_07775 [Actinobacillus seminis]|uniref:hypothetical protein n=1 Tax=Actinobacillus seminis TaxID=722 RepID=UPI003B962A06
MREIDEVLAIVEKMGVELIGDRSYTGNLTSGRPLSDKQREINRLGIALCREVLELQDELSTTFNRLTKSERKIVFGAAGVRQADLVSSMVQGWEIEDYSIEGKLKIVKGMMALHDLVALLPSRCALTVLKKRLEKGNE